jgi:hypothetical protein
MWWQIHLCFLMVTLSSGAADRALTALTARVMSTIPYRLERETMENGSYIWPVSHLTLSIKNQTWKDFVLQKMLYEIRAEMEWNTRLSMNPQKWFVDVPCTTHKGSNGLPLQICEVYLNHSGVSQRVKQSRPHNPFANSSFSPDKRG